MEIRNRNMDKRFEHLSELVAIRFEEIDAEKEAELYSESFTEMVHIEDNGEETYLRFWEDPEKVFGPVSGFDQPFLESVTPEDLFLGTFGYRNGEWLVIWLSRPYESEWVDYTQELEN